MRLYRNIEEPRSGASYSHAAVENIIDRGGRRDWGLLRQAMLEDEVTFRRVRETVAALREHPFSGRFAFWDKLCQSLEERRNTMSRKSPRPEWEELLSAAARTGRIVPEAVLAGGTACALYAHHRFSYDADFVLDDLSKRFGAVLSDLEREAGWSTERVVSPKIILGQMDGVDTCIRQLIRTEPLETERMTLANGCVLMVPTMAECLRIKCTLVLKRNAFRDYLDAAALGQRGGAAFILNALAPFDRLYPQPNGESAYRQLAIQFSDPRPFDLESVDPSNYKGIVRSLSSWDRVADVLADMADLLSERLLEETPDEPEMGPER